MVSIIVPVYGVEKYLKECIESLIKQTYDHIEIMLIDDESKDNSAQICDTYAKIDKRIHVMHKENGGAASARNAGLKMISGEYICFVDGDDSVKLNYIEKLVWLIEKYNADIAVCSYYYQYKDELVENINSYKEQVIAQVLYLKQFLTDWTCGLIWNKIFKREVLNNIFFQEGHKIDDEFFTYKTVMQSKKIALFDEPLYYYRMRASSVMNLSYTYSEQILEDKLDYLLERYKLVSKKYPELKKYYLENLVDNLISLHRKAVQLPEIELLIEKEAKSYRYIILMGNISLKQKYSFFQEFYFKKISDISMNQESIKYVDYSKYYE